MGSRILIVDDHEVVRSGLKRFLHDRGHTTIEEANNIDDALEILGKGNVGVVVLDLRLTTLRPGVHREGVHLLEQIRGDYPNVRVVIFTAFGHPSFIARCIQAGASDYILKGDSMQRVADAIRAAQNGESTFSRDDHRRMTGGLATPRLNDDVEAPLTHRECDVLRALAEGATNKQIADQLGISYETVKEHVQHILKKIGVVDRTQAVVWAIRRGIIQ